MLLETATITSTSTAGGGQERQGHKNSRLKIFLNSRQHVVDLFCAILLICLCLTVLLPRVHDSFIAAAEAANDDDHMRDTTAQRTQSTTTITKLPQPSLDVVTDSRLVLNSLENTTVLAKSLNSIQENDTYATPTVLVEFTQAAQEHDDNSHHHHHVFPTGEFLICVGFFVFYCVGFSLEKDPRDEGTSHIEPDPSNRSRATRQRPSTSTICCSSARCPQPTTVEPQQTQVLGSNRTLANGDQLIDELTLLTPQFLQRNTDEDCVMLLNPHHQHHTHNKHHDAAGQMTTSLGTSTTNSRQAYYGSVVQKGHDKTFVINRCHQTGKNDADGDFVSAETSSRRRTKIVVDEIRITSEPYDSGVRLTWPRSLKMLLISVILAALLVFLDMRVLGMLLAIKVFRACSTGALLYIAFFIMLPRDRAGCNSCKEEEI